MQAIAQKEYKIKKVEHLAEIPYGWSAEGYAMHILSLGNPVERVDTLRGCLVLYTREMDDNG